MCTRRVGSVLVLASMLTLACLPGWSASRTAQAETAKDLEPGPVALDLYGGYVGRVAEPTGFFTVKKIGTRWVFVTPLGNPFWMRSVYAGVEASIYPEVIARKYRGDVRLWSTQRNRRLLSWGFNTLGEYTSARGLPVGIWGGPPNDVKLPFILILHAAVSSMSNPTAVGLAEPVKDIIIGVPKNAYSGWRGRLVDVFDPKFAQAARSEVAYWTRGIKGGFADKPWVLGITPDDADYLFGMKSRGGAPVNAYPHIGWLVAVARSHYTPAEHRNKAIWHDPLLHSKAAWIAFLRKKYSNEISRLNEVWGTGGYYTSFESTGEYGTGTGVADEDGRHTRWMGEMKYPYTNLRTSPGVQTDVDTFLYLFARTYAETHVASIRATDKNHLIFGPASINNYGAKARDEILRGLADGGIDVFCWNYDPRTGDLSENQASYDLVRKPAFIWYSVTSNRDSGMHSKKPIYGAPEFASQEERGAHYRSDLRKFINARGSNGDHYIVGVNWWSLVDKASEGMNWGLVSRRDNAYDGREAVRAASRDPWGFSTGDEERDYGDFLTSVREANLDIGPELRSQLQAQRPPAK